MTLRNYQMLKVLEYFEIGVSGRSPYEYLHSIIQAVDVYMNENATTDELLTGYVSYLHRAYGLSKKYERKRYSV